LEGLNILGSCCREAGRSPDAHGGKSLYRLRISICSRENRPSRRAGLLHGSTERVSRSAKFLLWRQDVDVDGCLDRVLVCCMMHALRNRSEERPYTCHPRLGHEGAFLSRHRPREFFTLEACARHLSRRRVSVANGSADKHRRHFASLFSSLAAPITRESPHPDPSCRLHVISECGSASGSGQSRRDIG
jgi:hypothetical protein